MRLPILNERLGAVVKVLFQVLATITAVYVVTSLSLEGVDLFRNGPATARYGVMVQRTARGPQLVRDLYLPADRSPVRQGDLVLGVGDAPLPASATRFDLAAKLSKLDGKPAVLRIMDRSGTERRVTVPSLGAGLTQISPVYGMPLWLFGILHLSALAIIMLVLIGAAFLLYTRRPRDPEAMLLAFSFLAIIYGTSSGSWPFLYLRIPGPPGAYVHQVGIGLLCIAMAGMPEGRLSPVWGSLTMLFAVIYGSCGEWLSHYPFANPLWGMLATLPEFLAFFCATVALVLRYRHSAGPAQQQIKYVVAGAVLTQLAIVLVLILTYTGLADRAPRWGQYFLSELPFLVIHIAAPIGTLISIFAYRLYDSDAAITRSTAYAAASVAAVGVFAASESVVQSFGQQMVSGQLGAFPGTLAAVFTAMLIKPMHDRIKRFTERGFRRDFFRMREGLPPLVGDLRETTSAKEIAAVVIERVRVGLERAAAAIVMADGEVVATDVDQGIVAAWQKGEAPRQGTVVECDKADPLFPVRVSLQGDRIGLVGWLLLGPRPDGSLFGKDERAALAEIADPVARALAIAGSREARSALHERNNRMLQDRLDRMEAALAHLAATAGQGRSSDASP